MRRHCQTIAALLLTLLPRCGVVELGCAPAYGREGANEGGGTRGGSAWLGIIHYPPQVARNGPESPAEAPPRPKHRKTPRKVPGKRQPPLQPPVGPGGC